MITLTDIEARILGCLIEKKATTPDNYPLTINSLKIACNQKTSRNPIMNLEEGIILRNIRYMKAKNWLVIDDFGRVPKCHHRIDKILGIKQAALSVIAVLLLRQTQTFNEILTKVERLYSFASNELKETINDLIGHKNKLIVKLPKTTGKRENRYMHQLCGEIDLSNIEKIKEEITNDPLEKRIEVLEAQILDLTQQIKDLQES